MTGRDAAAVAVPEDGGWSCDQEEWEPEGDKYAFPSPILRKGYPKFWAWGSFGVTRHEPTRLYRKSFSSTRPTRRTPAIARSAELDSELVANVTGVPSDRPSLTGNKCSQKSDAGNGSHPFGGATDSVAATDHVVEGWHGVPHSIVPTGLQSRSPFADPALKCPPRRIFDWAIFTLIPTGPSAILCRRMAVASLWSSSI